MHRLIWLYTTFNTQHSWEHLWLPISEHYHNIATFTNIRLHRNWWRKTQKSTFMTRRYRPSLRLVYPWWLRHHKLLIMNRKLKFFCDVVWCGSCDVHVVYYRVWWQASSTTNQRTQSTTCKVHSGLHAGNPLIGIHSSRHLHLVI